MTENEIQTIKALNKVTKSLIKGLPSKSELQPLPDDVSGPIKDLAESLTLLTQKYQESRDFILALASGKLEHMPPKDNNTIAPFKQLHSDLLHLTWQTKEIARGDYNQKVSFMGDFSIAFNKMIESLKEKKKLEEKLIESNTAKDKFFSIIAHDLKSPFSSILGFMEMLNDEYDSLDESERKQFINYVFNDAKHIFNLILNLLSWSRTQTNRISFNPINFDLYALIEDNISLLQSSANKKEITITMSVPEKITIYADPEMISTVVRNLLSNAIKFTPKKGKIEVGSKGIINNKINVSVSDSGVGIKKENIPKFFKLSETHTTIGTDDEKGTGLGLIICKEFIKKHNGEIWVESEEGKGSKFIFTLPLE
jgi:signal transduction histidine kinase